MKTIFVLILFLFNLFTLSADSRINIPINEVLLYRDRTQITRVGNLEFKPGENKFILDSLPTLLSDDSLRAYSENPVLSITSIITFVEPGTEYKDKKFSSLKKQLDELESKRKQIERKKSNLINEKNVLEEYRKLTGESISKKAAYMSSEEDLKKWKETLNYFQSRSIELGKEIQKSDFELEDLDKLVNELNLKLDKIISSSGKSKRTVEIRVTNSTSKTIKSVFSISYLIGNSSWSPAYNIIGKEQDKADVEYLADIHQETGEDWDNVKVSLSTSEPKKSSTRPKVRAIEVFSEGGKTKKTFFSYESKSEESTVNTSSSTEVEKEGDLEGSIQEGAGGFIFRSSERANIKSKKESSRITISKFATELKTGLMTVPFKQRLIYTGGDLYNKISFPLLAGKAAIYKNSGYIGKILLPYTPSGSKVKISMGIENDIRVFYRKENSNFTDGFVKSKKVFDKTNIITIESFSKKSEEITIYDRIPVSEISDVDVELDKENTTQGFKWKGENEGILFWKIKIAPNEKKEIKLRFKIKAPEGAGLNF